MPSLINKLPNVTNEVQNELNYLIYDILKGNLSKQEDVIERLKTIENGKWKDNEVVKTCIDAAIAVKPYTKEDIETLTLNDLLQVIVTWNNKYQGIFDQEVTSVVMCNALRSLHDRSVKANKSNKNDKYCYPSNPIAKKQLIALRQSGDQNIRSVLAKSIKNIDLEKSNCIEKIIQNYTTLFNIKLQQTRRKFPTRKTSEQKL